VVEEHPAPVGIDVNTPNVARMWDYQLGGKDNFAADRAAADAVNEALRNMNVPGGKEVARENRAFLGRAVRFLTAEAGIRQFVDIGAGLPTQGNVHEIAQQIAPDARVAYVDYDPVVLAHGRALLAGDDQANIIQADMRRPEELLAHPDVRSLVDLTQPVGVLMIAVLHLLVDEEDPAGIVDRFMAAVPVGSYLVISHSTRDARPEAADVLTAQFSRSKTTAPIVPRSRVEIARFFAGVELVRPGLVYASEWRPDPDQPAAEEGARWLLAGVGRKSKD
jgi:S-adenosyl methyltransferase